MGQTSCSVVYSLLNSYQDQANTFDPLIKDFLVCIALQPGDDEINTCPSQEALKVPYFSKFTGPACR